MISGLVMIVLGVFLVYKGIQVWRSRNESVVDPSAPRTAISDIKAVNAHSTRKVLGLILPVVGIGMVGMGFIVMAVNMFTSSHHGRM